MSTRRWAVTAGVVLALLWADGAGPCSAGTHRAEFRLGGPGGFSRGAWDENVAARHQTGDGRVGLGLWGWVFTCRDGKVLMGRVGRGRGLGASDLGTGLGGPWPRPLVNGGLFVKTPRPGFGPYELPVTLEAELSDLSGFLGAGRPADGRPKFLGVVIEVGTGARGRVLCAGLKGEKGLTFGVYDMPGYKALAEGRALPKLAAPVGIKATVSGKDLVVSLAGAELRVPLKSPGPVRAIALRVAGVVGKAGPVDAVTVQSLALSAPNIPDHPVRPVALPKSAGPFLRRQGAELRLGGRAFHAVGMNQVRVLYHFAGLDANPAFGEYVLESLAREGFSVLRITCADHVPNFDKRGKTYALYRLFEQDRAAYFAAFDRLLASAGRLGIRLVPVVVWGPGNIADHLGTSSHGTPDFAAIRRTYFEPASREHGFLTRYLGALAGRYRDRREILCWEIGNEWQNSAPKTAYYYRYNPKKETPNPYIPRWKPRWAHAAGEDGWQQMARAQAVCARLLKAADPNHLVLSGTESVSVHFAPDGARYRQVMAKMTPADVDLMGYHQYANSVGRKPMKPWGYAPFLTRPGLAPWPGQVETIRVVAAEVHGGRPVVIGETNVHDDRRPATRAARLGNLRALLAAAANVRVGTGRARRLGPVRCPFVLGWKWLPSPDLVDGYSLYPASSRALYARPDSDLFVEQRLQVFRDLLKWYEVQAR